MIDELIDGIFDGGFEWKRVVASERRSSLIYDTSYRETWSPDGGCRGSLEEDMMS